MMTNGRQIKKATLINFNEGVEVSVGNVTMVWDVTNISLAPSRALHSKAKTAYQVLKVATREHRFVRDTSCNELKDLCELHTSSALHQNVSLELASPSYITRSARGQASHAHHVFSEEQIKESVQCLSNVMALGAHGHIHCSDLILYY